MADLCPEHSRRCILYHIINIKNHHPLIFTCAMLHIIAINWKNHWNFVCDDENEDIIMYQYKKSSLHIKNTLTDIKEIHFWEH